MLLDDHENYADSFPTAETSAEHSIAAAIDCCATFLVPKFSMSDGPMYLKNETLV